MEPRFNEVPRDIYRVGSVPYILKFRAEEYRSLYRGLRYIEVREIEVALC